MLSMRSLYLASVALLAIAGCGRAPAEHASHTRSESPRVLFESQALPKAFEDWETSSSLVDLASNELQVSEATTRASSFDSANSPNELDELPSIDIAPPNANPVFDDPPAVELNDLAMKDAHYVQRSPAPRTALKYSSQSPRAKVSQQSVLAEPLSSEELNDVRRRADLHARKAVELANRGALFSARDEFYATLQVIADAFDQIYGGSEHAERLAAAIQAMNEAEDFSTNIQQRAGTSAVSIARTHRTPILKESAESVSCMQAQRSYHRYAREQFIEAAGNEPTASLALYGLAKLQPMLDTGERAPAVAYNAKSAAYYQASLAVDEDNFLSGNELAVQYAHLGKWQDAYTLLNKSAPLADQPAIWRNLAAASMRLQLPQVAQNAQARATASIQRMTQLNQARGRLAASHNVVWVTPDQFAQQQVAWNAPPVSAPVSDSNTAPATVSTAARPNTFTPPPNRMTRAINAIRGPLR